MTVSSEVNRAGPYLGNGSTTVFGFGFRILSASHLRVIVTDEDGVETDLPYPSGYSVTGVGANAGGSITISPAPAAGSRITILRNVPMVQETDLENQGAYYAETIERQFDLVVMQNQQQSEELRRAVKVPAGDPDPDGALSSDLAMGILRLYASAGNIDTVAGQADAIDTVASTIVQVQTVATEIAAVQTVSGAIGDIGTVADDIADVRAVAGVSDEVSIVATNIDTLLGASGSLLSMVPAILNGDGTTTEFSIPASSTTANVIVWVNKVRQTPGDDYEVDTSTLTFFTAPAAGAEIELLIVTAVSLEAVQDLYDEFVEGVTIQKRNIITTTGQRRYAVDAAGAALSLRAATSAVFGASPFGMLTLGVDYTIDDGALLLSFDPADGELFHVVGFPRASNSQAQAILEEFEGRVAADADRAEAAATPFSSFDAAQAYALTAPASQTRISAIIGDLLVEWIRKAEGSCFGGGWAPAGLATPDHYNGNVQDAFADATELAVNTDYPASGLPVPGGSNIYGSGALRRTATGNLLNGDATGAIVEGLRLNMDRATLGNLPGHGMSLTGDDITVRGVHVYDYGSDGVGGGSGVLVLPASGQTVALRPRLENSHLAADPASAIGIGWIWDTTRFGFAGATLAEGAIGGIGYAHELKNDARYNNLYALTAWNSKVALAYGQQGGTAPSYNMSDGLIAAACDAAIVSGPGSVGNLYNGVLYDEAGSPGVSPSSNGVMFSGAGSTKQAIFAMASHGAPDVVLRLETPQTYAEVASYDTSPIIASFRPGAAKSVVDIVHPGDRTSIFGAISDTSGNANNGPNANVVTCEGTREYLGSISGSWTYRLAASGATFFTTHQFRYDNASGVTLAGGTDGATNSNFSLVHNIPGTARTGSLTHAIGAGEQYWDFRTNGVDVLRVAQSAILPRAATATYDIGGPSARFRNLYVVLVDYGSGVVDAAGTGTPEGVLAAGIGSTYRRRDGGAGTSFYVKETGAGNTGWVAK